MRAALKTTAEALLARGGPAHIGRFLRRSQALVLSYHNVVPDDCGAAGDASLHLAQRAFAAQLDALSSTHNVVPLDRLMGHVPGGPARPRVAITFDDAYRGAVTIGVDELARRGLPATIFVSPGLLGGHGFWWDRLADPAAGAIDPGVRQRALELFAGDGVRILDHRTWSRISESALPPSMLSATEDELRDAITRHPGIALASHSWSHPNLTRVDSVRLANELARPLGWLQDRFPGSAPVISYPYGLLSNSVRVAAARAGYTAGVTQTAGWLVAGTGRPFAVPRLNVPAGLSLDGFVARIAGLV